MAQRKAGRQLSSWEDRCASGRGQVGLTILLVTWDILFDELYLRTYAPLQDPAEAEEHALALANLLSLTAGADVLDCPCGYGRYAIPLARAGFHVVGSDRSPALIAEAERRAGGTAWPRFVQADYRELPFEDASFDCVLNLFSSLGYWGEEGDRRAIGEFRRVLRPGGKLVIETMHRDRLMAAYNPRSWQELPDGSLVVEERMFDYERGTIAVRHELVERTGGRRSVPYELRVYTATELIELVRLAGFEQIVCHGDYDGTPLSRDTRLVLVAN
jgi:SAM-dependent methyltransferase